MSSIDDHDRIGPRFEAGAPPRSGRALLWWLTVGYSVFVVYGSLVPLRFHARPLGEAWEHFKHVPYLELGIGSRADWVANVLLFVPLAFLWLGVLSQSRGRFARVAATVLVLAGSLGLSVAIEFTQIFFPPRTVSLNDIIAETSGAVIGIVLWWLTGKSVLRWMEGWYRSHTPSSAIERLLYAYLFLLFGYSVLPLDLTISMVEIYHKWQEGKVLLVPFSAVYQTGAQRAYALFADIAIWIPAAFLWRLASSRPSGKIILYVLACATAIEFLQLFVYSRVTSTTDILMAGCGAAIGTAIAKRLRPGVDLHESPRPSRGGRFALLWVLAFVFWTFVLMVVFWYPFNFSNEWGFVHGRLTALKRPPFETYYFGTEFRAVTEVFHKTGFFFPLGALLAIGAAGIRRRFAVPPLLLHAVSAFVVASAAAAIEIGQLFLPGKVADTTDWALETLGGLIGYLCLQALMPLWQGGRRAAMSRP